MTLYPLRRLPAINSHDCQFNLFHDLSYDGVTRTSARVFEVMTGSVNLSRYQENYPSYPNSAYCITSSTLPTPNKLEPSKIPLIKVKVRVRVRGTSRALRLSRRGLAFDLDPFPPESGSSTTPTTKLEGHHDMITPDQVMSVNDLGHDSDSSRPIV